MADNAVATVPPAGDNTPGELTELATRPIAETPADNTEEKQSRPKIPQVEKAELKDRAIVASVTQEDADAALALYGTTSGHFRDYAEKQLLNILLSGKDKDDTSATGEMNSLLAMLAGINPQNEMEAMLAAQMVATYHCTMRTMIRHNNAEDVARWEIYGRLASKGARTFTMQLEALAKLRRGGKQVVEHVHVNAGGQAVIAGTVNNGRGAK